jgi:predicted metal-dependent peptidase
MSNSMSNGTSNGTSKKAKNILTLARSKALIEEPFFGNLMMRLELVESNNFPAMAVDGQYQFYNSQWVSEQSVEDTMFLLCHEVMHLVSHHHLRREGRDPLTWNKACDYCVNAELKSGGWTLHQESLYNPLFEGRSSEQVYASLINEQTKGDEGGEEGKSDQSQQGHGSEPERQGEEQASGSKAETGPSSQGTDNKQEGQPSPEEQGLVMEPMDKEAHETRSESWDQAVVASAKQAEKAGNLPGSVARKVQQILHPVIPWKEQLREYFRGTSRDDLSYSRFNRRYVDQDLYLPSMYSEAMDSLVIFIDTSGSIDETALSAFLLEMETILQEVSCSEIHMGACDYYVQGDICTSYDKQMPADFKPRGGGGTRFSPAFEKIEELGLNPDLLVYFTDLRCRETYILEDPGFPVVWAKWGDDKREPKFGQIVNID